MSYIRINEIDSTIQNLAPITNDNIAYVPLNSTDGPSGVNVVLGTYGDFIQIFGNDPNPQSRLMSSWDYAANLLLRNIPVMVRRITSFVDDYGYDTMELLPGVSVARGLTKVKDVTGISIAANTLAATAMDYVYPYGVQNSDGSPAVPVNLDDTKLVSDDSIVVEYITSVDNVKNYISTKFNGTDYKASDDTNVTRSISGFLSITNDGDAPFELTDLKFIKFSATASGVPANEVTIYNANLTSYTTAPGTGEKLNLDPNLKFRDDTNTILDLTKSENTYLIEVQWADGRAFISLPAGYSITYEEQFSNSKIVFAGKPTGVLPMITIKSLESPSGRTITTLSTAVIEGEVWALPVIEDDNVNIDAAGPFDNRGNINLFKVSYRNPGTNGSRLATSMSVIDGDGIYFQVWNGTQRLENIQLVNLRYRMANGYLASYDLYQDKEKIWAMLLNNFNVIPPIDDQSNILANVARTEYVTIELNNALDWNCLDYLDSIYQQRGTQRTPLRGGSNPDDIDVIHEVSKTYKVLNDKYLYNVKFLTNGGYVDELILSADITKTPLINRRYIEDSMVSTAEIRGDCVAFVDIPFDIDRDDAIDYFKHLSTSYATSYAPWVQLNLLTRTTKWCPPSFVALWTIAKSTNRGNPVYAPPAGVNRANVSEAVDLSFRIPSEYIDTWQDNRTQFLNPIVYINGYGINIFGQRTLYNRVDGSYDTTSALQYLNVRLVANEIKKRIFRTCIELSFEYNNLHTWLSFKTKMSVLLDILLYNNHITFYDIVMDESTMTDSDIQSNRVVGTVSVAISGTAEKFDITFELLPNQVNFLNIDYDQSNVDAYGFQGYRG